MRTTIDLPDALLREVKATAALRGQKLKDFAAEAFRSALGEKETEASRHKREARQHQKKTMEFFRELDAGREQTGPLGSLDRDSLYDRHD